MSRLYVITSGFVDRPDAGPPPSEDQIKICTAWLMLHAVPRSITQRATISRKYTSYNLKHRVERWTHATGPHRLSDGAGNRWTSDYYYVSNGAMIEAALREGYIAERIGRTPNAYFNFTVKERA